MTVQGKLQERFRRALVWVALITLLSNNVAAFSQTEDGCSDTVSPIQHVIVLIGENRTFDHLFATYVSPSGDSVSNLLSKGIIKADGTPGPNFGKARQFQAVPPFRT